MPVGRIVLAPLPTPLGLLDYLAQNLPVPVELLDLANVFDLSRTPELKAPENQARYFVALGAALRGTRDQARRMHSLGHNVWLIRWIAFVYAGFWGGVAGLLKVMPNLLSIAGTVQAAQRPPQAAPPPKP